MVNVMIAEVNVTAESVVIVDKTLNVMIFPLSVVVTRSATSGVTPPEKAMTVEQVAVTPSIKQSVKVFVQVTELQYVGTIGSTAV